MKVRIATRGSRLALWQADRVSELLRDAGHEPELVVIRTTGDRRTDVPLAAIGGKGMFVKELEEALLANAADIAVHSLKDVPSLVPDRFTLAAFPEREDPRDAWLHAGGLKPDELPGGSVVATGSPRRASQLRARWPHLEVTGLRGNVDTRLASLTSGKHEAMILAMAGLTRLDLASELRAPLEATEMVPAAGQGILAIELLRGNDVLLEVIAGLSDERVEREARTERRVLEHFGVHLDCHSPIAVHAYHHDGALHVSAFAGAQDGSATIHRSREGDASTWMEIADALHEELAAGGALEMMNRGIA